MEGSKPVLGLTCGDFVIRDEQERLTPEYCGQESEPLAVLLLLDVSGSMKRYLEQMSKVAQRALSQLNEQDRAGVMIFTRQTALPLPLSSNRAEAAREIELSVLENSLPSGTAINAAILDAANELRADRQGRKQPSRYAVVILTDNSGLNYRVPDQTVLRALWAADAVLNAIVVGKNHGRRKRHSGNSDFSYPDVYKLAEESGGEAVAAERADLAFPAMIRAIRQRYALAYRLPGTAQPGAYRKIRVELSASTKRKYPRASLRARNGYHVPEN
jgi:VWFA-related protein